MFHLEHAFSPYASKFIPILIEQAQSPDQLTQKVSIDAFNSMASVARDKVIAARVEIL